MSSQFPSFPNRLGHVVRGALRLSDIVACFLWIAPLYLVCLADRPTGRQLISGYVGKAAHNGHKWGTRAAAVIDWLAMWVGDGPDHCRRAYEFYLPVDVEN